MYDITYCYGENCPIREDCQRFPIPKIARRNTLQGHKLRFLVLSTPYSLLPTPYPHQ